MEGKNNVSTRIHVDNREETMKYHVLGHMGCVLFMGHRQTESSRYDAANRGIPSGAILFAYIISSKNEIKNEKYS